MVIPITAVKPITTEKEAGEFWVGKAVKVLKADTFGGKDVKTGDLGIVTRIEDYNDKVITLSVDILPVKDWGGRKNWLCVSSDVEVVSSKLVENVKLLPIIEGYISFNKKRVRAYRGCYDNTLNELCALQSKTEDLRRQLRDTSIIMKNINSTCGRMDKDKIANKIKLVIEKYVNIEYSPNFSILSAETKPVILTFQSIPEADNGDGEVHKIEMGRYKVNIDILKNTITFKSMGFVNPIHPQMPPYPHPHISTDGLPCWGSWQEHIQRCLGENKYLEALLYIYDFLCSCDPYGWYISAFAYEKDAEKKCTGCWKLLTECTCGRCPKCREFIEDNCQCNRCPRSGDLIEDQKEYCSNANCIRYNTNDNICNY